MTFNTPEATFTGNVQIDGDLNTDGDATLGGPSGQPIARLGDQVTVGASTGTITSASGDHKAT